MEEHIVHICTRTDWENAKETEKYQPPSLESEGFIHCSRPEQVLTVINRFYAQVPDLILLWINPNRVAAEIRWEASDGDIFPHIYGPLNINEVVAVRDIFPDPDGVYRGEVKL